MNQQVDQVMQGPGGVGIPLPDDPAQLQNHLAQQQGQIDTLMQLVAALQARPDRGRHPNIRAPDYKDEPEHDIDFLVWRSRFQRICAANGWDDAQCKNVAMAAMHGKAHLRVKEMHTGMYATVNELLDAMENLFMPKASTPLAQANFERACQGPKEDLATYHARLRALFRRAYPEEAGNADPPILMRKFVASLKDKRIQNYAIWARDSGGQDTYEKLLLACQHEYARALQGQLYTHGATTQPLAQEPEPMELGAIKGQPRASPGVGPRRDGEKRIPCSFCGRTNHWDAQCRQAKQVREIMEIVRRQRAMQPSRDPSVANSRAASTASSFRPPRARTTVAALEGTAGALAQPLGAIGSEAGATSTADIADAMLNAIAAGVDDPSEQGEEEEDDGVDGELVAAIHQALNA